MGWIYRSEVHYGSTKLYTNKTFPQWAMDANSTKKKNNWNYWHEVEVPSENSVEVTFMCALFRLPVDDIRLIFYARRSVILNQRLYGRPFVQQQLALWMKISMGIIYIVSIKNSKCYHRKSIWCVYYIQYLRVYESYRGSCLPYWPGLILDCRWNATVIEYRQMKDIVYSKAVHNTTSFSGIHFNGMYIYKRYWWTYCYSNWMFYLCSRIGKSFYLYMMHTCIPNFSFEILCSNRNARKCCPTF